MDEDDLSCKFEELSMNSAHSLPFIAGNHYYYSLALNEVEKKIHLAKAAEIKAQKSTSNGTQKLNSSLKKKKDKRVIETVESNSGKFKNIRITVQNDQSQRKAFKSQPETPISKNTKEKDTKNLLEQLKMLKTGKIKSDAIISSHAEPKKKIERNINEATAEQKLEAIINSVGNTSISTLSTSKMMKNIDQKRAEIGKLNKIIKEKIERVKPRLNSIAKNGDKSSITTESSPLQLPKLTIPKSKLSNDLNITKTQVEGNEIYRYTKDELYVLQQYGTWEKLPRLLELNICRTQLSPLDNFLMKLIESSNYKRNELILNKAEERNFISRSGLLKYSYLRPNFCFENSQQQLPSLADTSKVGETKSIHNLDYVERYKLIAKTNDELNQLIYRHEFMLLFETALEDQELQDKSLVDIANHLVETKQAYIVEGEIRVNQRNNQEAYVSNIKGMKDVCVKKLILRKHAFHGDIVRVLVKSESNGNLQDSPQSSPEVLENDLIEEILSECRNFGVVLDILEKRHSRRVLGTFFPFFDIKKNKKHLMVNSRDTKIPNIRVNTRTGIPIDTEINDKLVISIEIIGWIHDQPQGKVVSIIGKKGQLKTENAAILQQNNLDPKPFEQNILDQLPSEPFEIPEKEFAYREDLRKKCIFSIDPETARDLDDALSCEILPNGNLEVGVHISDVSYFVKEDSDLDKIVRDTATTIYLVDTVYHMLPEKLCLMCSLLPGSDKMAYSVFFEMDPSTAEVRNVRFTRSVVNSCAKLSYDHAQMVIDKKDQEWSSLQSEFPNIYNGFTIAQLANVITKLQSLAVIMRANRKAKGALKIDQPKLSFKFGKDDQRMETPQSFSKYCSKDSNRLIEEFMLLANISVATFIYEKYPDVSLLRHHEVPSESAMKKLVKLLAKHRIELDNSSSGALSKSMENLITFAKCPSGMNAAINMMVSKTMSRAKYFCSFFGEQPSDFSHYALSIPIYTHFTSPIRRYADILVHRVLNAALGYEELTSKSPEEIQKLAINCNTQKYNAKLAGDDSSNLYFIHFIQSLKSITMTAAVLGIFDFNLEVILVDTGHVIKVYYKNLQQSDDVVIKTFCDNTPPYATFHYSKNQSLSPSSSSSTSSMKIEFGMEILVQVEVIKDKLTINKIFYNQ